MFRRVTGVVFGELPRLRRAGRRARRRAPCCATCSPTFRARCSSGFRRATPTAPSLTLPFGVRGAPARRAGAGVCRSRRPRSADGASGPSDRHLRHGDGDAGGAAKRRGHDVSGSDEDVYPPMSDFLAAEGIRMLEGYRRRAHHPRPRPRRRRQRDLARQRGARGGARSEDPLLLAARGDPRAFLWGARSIVVAGTHGKTTTTALTGWLLTQRRRRSERARRRHRPELRRPTGRATASARGRDFVIEGDEYDSAYFDKTAKFLKYLPDIAVINNIEFDHADIYADLDAVRAGVPPARQPRAAPRPAAARRRQPGRARRSPPTARSRGADVRPGGRRRRGRRPTLEPATAARSFQVQGAATDLSARSTCRCSARTTCATRWRRSPSAPNAGSAPSAIAQRACARSPASSAGSRWSASARRHGLRRLRASSDRGRRDAAGAAGRASRPSDLGGLRAALGVVVPAVFQDDFARAFAGADEVVIAPVFRIDAARGRAPVGHAAGRRPARGRRVARANCRTSTTSSARVVGRSARRRPRRGDVQRRLRRHSREAARGAGVTALTRPRLRQSGDSLRAGRVRGARSTRRSTRASIALAAALVAARVPACATSCRRYASVGVHFDPLHDRRRGARARARRAPGTSRPRIASAVATWSRFPSATAASTDPISRPSRRLPAAARAT